MDNALDNRKRLSCHISQTTNQTNTQHCKVQIKGRRTNLGKECRPLLPLAVVAIENGAFGSPSTSVGQLTAYIYIYVSIYIDTYIALLYRTYRKKKYFPSNPNNSALIFFILSGFEYWIHGKYGFNRIKFLKNIWFLLWTPFRYFRKFLCDSEFFFFLPFSFSGLNSHFLL